MGASNEFMEFSTYPSIHILLSIPLQRKWIHSCVKHFLHSKKIALKVKKPRNKVWQKRRPNYTSISGRFFILFFTFFTHKIYFSAFDDAPSKGSMVTAWDFIFRWNCKRVGVKCPLTRLTIRQKRNEMKMTGAHVASANEDVKKHPIVAMKKAFFAFLLIAILTCNEHLALIFWRYRCWIPAFFSLSAPHIFTILHLHILEVNTNTSIRAHTLKRQRVKWKEKNMKIFHAEFLWISDTHKKWLPLMHCNFVLWFYRFLAHRLL